MQRTYVGHNQAWLRQALHYTGRPETLATMVPGTLGLCQQDGQGEGEEEYSFSRPLGPAWSALS
jgi:hypothetical protein